MTPPSWTRVDQPVEPVIILAFVSILGWVKKGLPKVFAAFRETQSGINVQGGFIYVDARL